jgi:hypothetical protein
MVESKSNARGSESAEELGGDVDQAGRPREPAKDREGDGDGRVEMSA